jgi:predicted  nucleic acid-binding Zn-ribbon protein
MLRHTARKTAGVFFALAILVLLFSGYVALVYHGDIDVGAEQVVAITFGAWIAAFAILLAVIFLVLLILFLARVETPATEQPLVGNEVTINCRDCHKDYVITDTGERPLLHACPHCGFTDQYPPVDETATVEAVAEGTPVPADFGMGAPGSPEALVIHCTSCGTNFEVGYTEDRPLVLNCSHCGKRGILRPNAPTHPAPIDSGRSSGASA